MGKTKDIESQIITIGRKHGLSPKQLVGLQTYLESDKRATQEIIADAIGVTRETYNRWLHQEKFQKAIQESYGLVIVARWPRVIAGGLEQAENGDLGWAKLLAQLVGFIQQKVPFGNEVHVNVNGNGAVNDEDRKEIEEAIQDIRQIKANLQANQRRRITAN